MRQPRAGLGREARTDYLKAAAIFGVVYIHAEGMFSGFFRFCVPIFIGLWAYYYECGLARRERVVHTAYVFDRFVRLLVPYLFWTVIYLSVFYTAADFQEMPWHTIIGGMFGGYGWAGQYFFIILFQLTLLMPLLRQWVNKYSVWAVIAIGLLINAITDYVLFENRIISGLGDRLFIYWLPYVFLGIALARGYVGRKPKLLILALGILMLAPMELSGLPDGSPYLVPSVVLGSVLLLLAAAPNSVTMAQKSMDMPARPYLLHITEYLGRNTFPIFVSNVLFMEILKRAGWSVPGSPGLIAGALVGGVIVGWLFRRLRLGMLVGSN